MDPLRLLIADDHALLRAGLRRLLDSLPGIAVVAEAADGRAAVAAVRDHEPDLVLLDVALPELNGLEACARITSRFPRVGVLMLSMHAHDDYVRRAIRNGASGYLHKGASAEELQAAIRAVVTGERYLCTEVASRLQDDTASHDHPLDRLTSRQREILQLVAEGYTTRAIAERLHLSAKTVDSHRANLMRELDIHDVTGLVRFALRNGLIPDDVSH